MSVAILDLDIGNSRTKWRFEGRAGALASPALPSAGDLGRLPGRVRVAAVAGRQAQVAASIRDELGVAAEFAAVTAELGGVVCAYAEPASLGVDRWLALVAAWRQSRGATVVVDAGTAVTVDLVDAGGRHRGGFIAPGLSMMRRALAGQTRDVGFDPPDAEPGGAVPGTTTAAAVAAGTFAMLRGFVEHVVGALAGNSGGAVTVFLCGGDAEALASSLPLDLRVVPELVLDGLAIALP